MAGSKPRFSSIRTRIDKQGRIIIPAGLRHQLGLEPGAAVSLRVEDGALRVVTIENAIKQAQQVGQQYTEGRTGLVDEFIAERRREAKRE